MKNKEKQKILNENANYFTRSELLERIRPVTSDRLAHWEVKKLFRPGDIINNGHKRKKYAAQCVIDCMLLEAMYRYGIPLGEITTMRSLAKACSNERPHIIIEHNSLGHVARVGRHDDTEVVHSRLSISILPILERLNDS